MFFGQSPFPKEFFDLMEKTLMEKINETIRDPKFLDKFGQTLGTGLDGKKKMDDFSREYLEKLNFPTRDDVAKILQYLQQVEAKIIEVDEKIEDLTDLVKSKQPAFAEKSVSEKKSRAKTRNSALFPKSKPGEPPKKVASSKKKPTAEKESQENAGKRKKQ